MELPSEALYDTLVPRTVKADSLPFQVRYGTLRLLRPGDEKMRIPVSRISEIGKMFDLPRGTSLMIGNARFWSREPNTVTFNPRGADQRAKYSLSREGYEAILGLVQQPYE